MSIPTDRIDPDAQKVVHRLSRHGYQAYLVGGCVRDLLLDRKPKDFDVATSATPGEIRSLFRNCRIIGRRFQLAHIFFGPKIIETSTFRQDPRGGEDPEEDEELLIRHDNVFGTAEEDARRRDFTINGLFYDLSSNEVIDYVGGQQDLAARTIRTIGDPDIRFREDPVRILRAIKFAARLDFRIEEDAYQAILTHRDEIPRCAPPRVLEEVYRLLRGGAARRSMELLVETGVAGVLAPELHELFGADEADEATTARRIRARALLDALDEEIRKGRIDGPPQVRLRGAERDEVRTYDGAPVARPTNALLLSTLLVAFMEERPEDEEDREYAAVVEEVLLPVCARLRVSRRDAERARQILLAQRRLSPRRRRRTRPMALVKRDYFAEALVLYEMRLGQSDMDDVNRWRSLWRKSMGLPVEGEAGAGRRRKRRRRRGGRRRRRSQERAAGEGRPGASPEGGPESDDPEAPGWFAKGAGEPTDG